MALRKTPAVLAIAFLCVLFSVQASHSQNFEGPGLLKFGVFGQSTSFNASYGAVSGQAAGEKGFDRPGVGVSLGYDWRMGRVVAGAEADLATINEGLKIASGSIAVDFLSTFRGRVGFFAMPGLQLYGTAGVSVANVAYQPTGVRRIADFASGWVAGGGAEFEWNDMILFAEYLHTEFGEEELKARGASGLPLDASAGVARVGVKMKIGFDY